MGESKGYIRNSDDKGSINISEDVIAVIAAASTMDVDGVNGFFFSHGKEITHKIGKKGFTKGVDLMIDGDEVTIDVHIIADMGYSVSEVGAAIQKAVGAAIEDAVGAKVVAVNVHIRGVALRKPKTKE